MPRSPAMGEIKRRWRDYRTAGGGRAVKKFPMSLRDADRAAIADEMKLVREKGLREGNARHLRGGIWEARVDRGELTYRILFASVGETGRILLALEGFAKKTRKTPSTIVELAEARLKDWNARGDSR